MHKTVKGLSFQSSVLSHFKLIGFSQLCTKVITFHEFSLQINKCCCVATSLSPWEMLDITDPDDCFWQHTQRETSRLGRDLKNWLVTRILTQRPIPHNGKNCFQRLPLLNAKESTAKQQLDLARSFSKRQQRRMKFRCLRRPFDYFHQIIFGKLWHSQYCATEDNTDVTAGNLGPPSKRTYLLNH